MIGFVFLGIFIVIGLIYVFYYCYYHAKWYGDWRCFFSCLRRSNYTKASVISLVSWLIAFIIIEEVKPVWISFPIGFSLCIFLGSEDNVKRKDKVLDSICGKIALVRSEIIDGQGYLEYKERERERVGYLSEEDESTIKQVKNELDKNKIELYDLKEELEKEKNKDLKFYSK